MIRNDAWSMFMEDGRLFISRGGDELYYLDEVAPENAERLMKAYQEQSDSFMPPEGLETEVELLVKAGVLLENVITPLSRVLPVTVRWYGEENQSFVSALEGLTNGRISFVPENEAQLLLLMRTSLPLSELMQGYDAMDKPHLLLDFGYAHTISAGPLIFPGETACLSCFAGRLTAAWGNPPPPKRPAVLDRVALAAGLTAEFLLTIAEIGTHPELVNQTVSFDTTSLKTEKDTVFTLPWCPYCYPNQHSDSGRLDWRDAR